jgi:hypothetical protein
MRLKGRKLRHRVKSCKEELIRYLSNLNLSILPARQFLWMSVLLSCVVPVLCEAQAIPGIALDPPVAAGPPQPGQLPNTISAPAMTARDKFDYRVVQSVGLRGFVGAAIGASIGTATNTPREWGQGVGGFAERYGSGFAANLTRQTLAFVIDNALREDPRYFPSEEKAGNQRVLNALKQVVWTKTDHGGSSFAYARVISAFGAGEISGRWQPASTNSIGRGVTRTGISLGGDFAYNMMQEFLPFTRPSSLRHRH